MILTRKMRDCIWRKRDSRVWNQISQLTKVGILRRIAAGSAGSFLGNSWFALYVKIKFVSNQV